MEKGPFWPHHFNSTQGAPSSSPMYCQRNTSKHQDQTDERKPFVTERLQAYNLGSTEDTDNWVPALALTLWPHHAGWCGESLLIKQTKPDAQLSRTLQYHTTGSTLNMSSHVERHRLSCGAEKRIPCTKRQQKAIATPSMFKLATAMAKHCGCQCASFWDLGNDGNRLLEVGND